MKDDTTEADTSREQTGSKDQLDRNYIQEQGTLLGIQKHEEKARTIAYKLFEQQAQDFSFLTQEENEYIEYYFSSGTYGTTR